MHVMMKGTTWMCDPEASHRLPELTTCSSICWKITLKAKVKSLHYSSNTVSEGYGGYFHQTPSLAHLSIVCLLSLSWGPFHSSHLDL